MVEKIKLKGLDLVPDMFGSTHHLVIYQKLSTKFKVKDIYLSFPPYPVIDSATIHFALDKLTVYVMVSLTKAIQNVEVVSPEQVKIVLNFLSSLEVFPEFKLIPPDRLILSKAVKLQSNVIHLPKISLWVEPTKTSFVIPDEEAKTSIKVATELLDLINLPWLRVWFVKPDGLGFVTKIKEKNEYFLEIGVVPWNY